MPLHMRGVDQERPCLRDALVFATSISKLTVEIWSRGAS
jgi:hypothetical protein